jgi:hypothetical protein
MNRTDELTDRLIDGTLTDAEAVELHALLEADANAQARHRALVRLELVLRGLRTEFDFAEPTVGQIEANRVERTTAAVMAELAARPAPDRGVRPTSRRHVWAALAALTAAIVAAVWLGLASSNPVPVRDFSMRRTPEFARLTAISGSVEVVTPGGVPVAAKADQPLSPGSVLRAIGEESAAVVEFPDRTRVEVHPETAVRFAPAAEDAAQRIILVQGRVKAIASGHRIVVAAGVTEVEATRGSFSLWSSGLGSARVEPGEGDVRVVRGTPAEPVVLSPGRAAFVRDELTPVRIESMLPLRSTPLHRLDFPALDVGFAADGEVWAVSAKQWARWKPGTPDPGRVLFPPKVFNDGLAAKLTPDLGAVAICRVDDRDEGAVRLEPQGKNSMREHIELMMDLVALAFQTDMTRVVTHSLGGEGGPNYEEYKQWAQTAGAPVRGAHDVHHKGGGGADSPDAKVLAARDEMLVGCFARLVAKLKGTRAADGTLLDHTVLLLGGAQISSHSGKSFPTLLAGGRKLGLRHGQHLKWDSDKRPMSDQYLTILQQLGCPVKSFKESAGPIGELLA